MIVTPPSFEPLSHAADESEAVTLVFRANEILLGDPQGALAAAKAVASLRPAFEGSEPVGRLAGRLFRAAWVAKDVAAPEGHAFKGLRSLFGKLDDDLVAVAGRGFQLADWAR